MQTRGRSHAAPPFVLILGLALSHTGCAEKSGGSRVSDSPAARQAGLTASPMSRADSLLRMGDAIYTKSADSARKLWTLALADASASGDSANIARALTGLGQAARLLGDFPTSRRLGE